LNIAAGTSTSNWLFAAGNWQIMLNMKMIANHIIIVQSISKKQPFAPDTSAIFLMHLDLVNLMPIC